MWRADGSGEPVVALRGHDDPVQSAAFSPDGTRVVTASFDRTARVWRVEWMALMDYLTEATNACLTEERTSLLLESQADAAAAFETCERSYNRTLPP